MNAPCPGNVRFAPEADVWELGFPIETTAIQILAPNWECRQSEAALNGPLTS
jgi:hypothetical protein